MSVVSSSSSTCPFTTRRTISLPMRTLNWARVVITSANSYVYFSSSSGSTSSSKRPSSHARWAWICWPDMRIHLARDGPARSTTRLVDSRLYTRPSFAGVIANRALVSAKRRSQARASPAPPPMQ